MPAYHCDIDENGCLPSGWGPARVFITAETLVRSTSASLKFQPRDPTGVAVLGSRVAV